jgi:hypothetical protein
MGGAWRERLQRGVLVAFGAVSLAGLYPLMRIWPSGWRWHPYGNSYEHMLVVVYAVLGAFMLHASRDPGRHRSLILFAGWSSVVHAGVMAADAIRNNAERSHLTGDVAILAIAGMLILLLAPPDTTPRAT